MKISFSIIFLLLILIAITLPCCRAIKDPVYKGIDNLKITKLDVNESTLSLQINYFNPNKWRLRLKEAEGDAWLDGTFLGHFRMDTLIHIDGTSDFAIPVKLGVDMKQVFKNALNVIFNPEVLIKIDGRARLGKGGVYIRYPIHFESKQNISGILK